MKDVTYGTRSYLLAKVRTTASIAGVMLAVISLTLLTLFAGHVLTIAVTQQVDVMVSEGLLQTWHQSHESDTSGDWLGPFLLRGEKASITWVMKDGTVGPDQEAQLCNAMDRSCPGPSVVVAEQVEFGLKDGGFPEEGWYSLFYDLATGQLKSVVIYLYY